VPMKLNLGLSRKLGQPDYGSVGASCHVEVELDGGLLQHDLDAFHRHVRNTYVACAQAVNDELARQQSQAAAGNGTNHSQPTAPSTAHHSSPRFGNDGRNGNGPAASQKQLDYLNQLARQIKGLGVRRLEDLSQRMFAKPVAGLSGLDASGLIDMLKAIKAGEVNLDDALNGAAT